MGAGDYETAIFCCVSLNRHNSLATARVWMTGRQSSQKEMQCWRNSDLRRLQGVARKGLICSLKVPRNYDD